MTCRRCSENTSGRCSDHPSFLGCPDPPVFVGPKIEAPLEPGTVQALDAHAVGIPTEAAKRKAVPIATGVLDYFPDALAEIARVSKAGNDQHHPGQPLHWDKSKSTDEADALVRHLIQRGTRDVDGMRHSAKVAWRALAMLQRELDAEKARKAGGTW
jgi:hypothetical protein